MFGKGKRGKTGTLIFVGVTVIAVLQGCKIAEVPGVKVSVRHV